MAKNKNIDEETIKKLIEKHYKTVKVLGVTIIDSSLFLRCTYKTILTYEKIAVRILLRYEGIKTIDFVGCSPSHFFTRETLKYLGYKMA